MLAVVENEQLRDALGSLKASQEIIWEVMEPWAQQPQESSGLQRCRLCDEQHMNILALVCRDAAPSMGPKEPQILPAHRTAS